MNAQHRVADSLMHRYIEEVLRRQRGESSGLRSLMLVMSGYVTACCGVTPSTTKAGEAKCPECHKSGDQCVLKSWYHARSLERAARPGEIHVHETRSIDRDREDRRMVKESDRWLWLRRMIEPRPRAVSEREWYCALAAWSLVLLHGSVHADSPEELERFEVLRVGGFGAFSTWTHRQRVHLARSVIARRTISRRLAA